MYLYQIKSQDCDITSTFPNFQNFLKILLLFYGNRCETARKYLPNVSVVSQLHYIVSLCNNLIVFSFYDFFRYYHDILWRSLRHHEKIYAKFFN